MTDKKERILAVALELFANDGYNSVSTSKIASTAGVSEGLIFRHFKNKKGLLDSILKDTEERLAVVFSDLNDITNPKEVLRFAIEMPFTIPDSQYDFWKLQFKLKWQKEYYHPEKMKPLADKLTIAFEALGYANPAIEANFLVQSLDTVAIHILREGIDKSLPFKDLMLSKYDLL